MKFLHVILGTILLSVSAAFGADSDIRLGTFEGKWGGFPCRYELTQQTDPGKLSYTGKILILDTKQYDKIWITQRGGKLQIVRYLSGKNAGRLQSATTYPPETKRNNSGQIYYLYRATSGGGPGMEGNLSYLRIFPE